MPGRNRPAEPRPAKLARQPRTRGRNPKDSASTRQPARIPLPTQAAYRALQPTGFAPSCAKAAIVAKLALPVKEVADSDGIFPRSSMGHPGDITHGGARSCVLFEIKLE